ncbi:uncharacterized protein BO97DRAFT_414198 [Aspergillus homomorphus CBS 101889]|uniref:Apple domain-containing protein n=1 Tax=Aspergillus homomorphus (strain CBS 101889) TaxID=1450537 RepID=A0A395HY88_ASPHC|nr:hypothetical protein BO97DRAFT_414198 [Aspergillus homomorphus CBS 101889]RAL12405.1 hypothetical protein BO97DRAFT_414198 [Aspergillus homomorphus CBS 101889]
MRRQSAMYWLSLLLAASTALAKTSTTTSFEICNTVYGSTSTFVRTVNSLSTATSIAILTTTSTPTVISTAAAKTITSVVTDTVLATRILDQSTSTFSTTVTSSIIVTVYDTVTDIETVTSDTTVTTTPTTTIPPPADFTAASALSQPPPILQGVKRTPFAKAAAAAPAPQTVTIHAAPAPQTVTIHAAQASAAAEDGLYPSIVTCAGLVEVYSTSTIVRDATKTSTVVVTPSAKTTTSTTHPTSTITLVPVPASTTVTITTNIIKSTAVLTTTKSTETKTNTATIQAPTQTEYAACGPDNQIRTINGRNITEVVVTGTYETISSSTPYDCCVACLNHDAPCAGYLAAAGAGCYLILPGNGNCTPGSELVNLGDGVDGFTVGNSGCGAFGVGTFA